MKAKVLFLGTANFAVTILQMLQSQSELEVVGVVTQSDKLAGRDNALTMGQVKEYLVENGFSADKIFQPEKLRAEAATILSETMPDLIIVAAYGQIVPKEMVDYPKLGALNLHGSLLPQLRGAVPVEMAIWHGLTVTGVTLQFMSEKMDEGDIVAQKAVAIREDETAMELKTRLADLGAELLKQQLPSLLSKTAPRQPQEHEHATYCYERDIAKDKAEIKFETPVAEAERMVRALQPWPVAWVNIQVQGRLQRLKIFKAKLGAEDAAPIASDFQVIRLSKQLFLQLQNGNLELLEVQLEGKKRDGAINYLFLALG
jgi:methionyl-tRNA formyltransferase